MLKNCLCCNNEFNARRNTRKFCSFECSATSSRKERQPCPTCGKEVSDIKNTYCSRSCSSRANSFVSEETKNKISKSMKEHFNKTIHPYKGITKATRKMFLCPICESSFEDIHSSTRKTCGSKACISEHRKRNTGGYREGSGRSKHGYYQGIYCGSTYELVWVMYNIHHNIKFNRFDGYITYGDGKKYFPDFIIGNTIIEIKGYHTELVNIKSSAAISSGYNISVLYRDDLEYAFRWFKETFPKSKLIDMYE